MFSGQEFFLKWDWPDGRVPEEMLPDYYRFILPFEALNKGLEKKSMPTMPILRQPRNMHQQSGSGGSNPEQGAFILPGYESTLMAISRENSTPHILITWREWRRKMGQTN
ncbi:MAG: hypothetical protein ACREA4_07840 [Nitrososphaera sp.]